MLTPFGRKIKQTNIVLSFLVFLLLIAAIFWFFYKKPEPLGKIEGLQITDPQIQMKSKGSKPPFVYEVSVQIKNPNLRFIAKNVDYILEIKNEKGEVLTQKKGECELEENKEKKIQEELSIEKPGKTFHFRITNVNWQRVEKKQ